jgi:hypothetical protein
MALNQSAFLELIEELKLTDVTDRIPFATEALYQALIDAEAAAFIGAARYERAESRIAVSNGSRARTLSTTAGELDLRIPRLRAGSFFPSLLERRRRVDQAPMALPLDQRDLHPGPALRPHQRAMVTGRDPETGDQGLAGGYDG